MFPDDFWWGTAACSTQTEGAAPASDWAQFERDGRAPPSGAGSGFGSSFDSDFRLLHGAGLPHHRLTIEWARIEPAEGQIDRAAVEHYEQMLAEARDAGIKVWAGLHHFSLPGWFLESGGFLEDRSRGRYWPRHVAFCAEAFGGDVFGWAPINEPVAYAARAYMTGDHPPGGRSPWEYGRALRGIHLAWRDAWRELRGGGPPVMTVYDLSPIFTVEGSRATRDVADDLDLVSWRLWTRAQREGVLAVPGRAEEVVPDLAASADLIGFSYYHAVAVGAEGALVPYPSSERVGPLGYAPWSEGLGLVIRRLFEQELPGQPLVVAAHGVGTDDDGWRRDVLKESLAVVEEAIDDGIDVRGFFHWTAVDGYEWRNGFRVPFGLFDSDREPRESAALFSPASSG